MKDTLGPAILSTIERLSSTMEPLNEGHFGTSHFVHYREVVLLLWEMIILGHYSRETVLF